MDAIFLKRERIITDLTTDYKLVILDGVDETREPIRNPNLEAQLEAVKAWNIPVLLRVVVKAQDYADSVPDIDLVTSWEYWMNKWLLDNVSAVLHNPPVAHGFLITSAIDAEKGTTSAWVKTAMMMASNFIFEHWHLPVWFEFTASLMNNAWDKGTEKYGQMQAFLESKEWIDRGQISPMLDSKVLVMPENTLSYISFKPAEPEVNPEVPENPEVPGSVPVNADILKQLDAIVIYLDSIQKLLESYAPWRR